MCKSYNSLKEKTSLLSLFFKSAGLVFLVLCLCGFDFFKKDPVATELKGLTFEGQLQKGNLLVDITYEYQAGTDNKEMTLLTGDFALISDSLAEAGKLAVVGKELRVKFKKKGDVSFKVCYAIKKEKLGEGFKALFQIPDYQVRPVTFNPGKLPLDLKLHSLLKLKREEDKTGKVLYRGFMKLGETFALSWKPRVEKLEKELSLICKAHSVVNMGVGSLKVSSLFDYKIVQGTASQLLFKVPENFSVTRLNSKTAIKDWQVVEQAGQRMLEVNFRKKETGNITMQIDGEQAMMAFPAKVKVGHLEPQNVLRVSGFLALGTDSAIKILVTSTEGITQVESSSFVSGYKKCFSTFPRRSLFVYNFAALPLQLELTADKIAPVIFSDNQLQYKIGEADLQLQAQVEVEVRDSAVREIDLVIDKRFNVSSVRAADMKDYEILQGVGQKTLRLYFKQGVIGKRLLNVNLEWSHKGWEEKAGLPGIFLAKARTVRGFLSIQAAEGLLADLADTAKLRKVPVASLPLRNGDIQSAWRFKSDEWSTAISVKRKKTALYSELFHLYSLGENVIYGSVSVTAHISGAPIDQLKLKLPAHYRNVEVIGLHRPRLYKEEGETRLVKLQRKINGDYALLVTFEINNSTSSGEFTAGGVELPESDSETGFITISGPTGLKASVSSVTEGSVQMDPDQVPAAYRLLHSHPVHLAFKYVRSPHTAKIGLKAYEKVGLIDQVVEHSMMSSKISANGERVTQVECWIKNSSRQYLSLKLPAKSNFWTCLVDGEKVRCTSQNGLLQIPVPRNADPNKTIHVQFSYAEIGAALKEGMPFTMNSPEYTIPAVFNEWELQLPGGFSIYDQEASMDVIGQNNLNSRIDILGLMERFINWSTRSAQQFLLMFGLGLFLFSVCWHMKQVRVFGCVIALTLVGWSGSQLISRTQAPVYQHKSLPSLQVMNFKKTVSAANEVQKISGVVKDDSIQVSGESKPAMLYLLLGLVLIALSCWWRNFIPCFAALVSFWFGCRGNISAEYYFAVSMTMLIPIAGAVGLTRYMGLLIERWRVKKALVATAVAVSFILSSPLSASKKVNPYKKIDSVAYQIAASAKTAKVEATFAISALKDDRFLLLSTPCALIDMKYDKKKFKLSIARGRCEFKALKDSQEKVVIVFELALKTLKEGKSLEFYMPPAMKNRAQLQVAGAEQEFVSPEAIFFLNEPGNKVISLFRDGCPVSFNWHPLEKKISEIPAVYYAETKSLVVAAEGHVDLQHLIDLKIARGEIKRLLINVPEKQAVTSVVAKGLSNWAYDPKTKVLELLFANGLKQEARLLLATQLQSGKMPYQKAISLPQVLGASRQNGLLAVGSHEGVKVQVNGKQSLQEIDSLDFQVQQFSLNRKRPADSLIFTYRYFKFPVSLSLSANRVLPEIEVQDHSNFSIGDERLVLSSRFEVNIKKAGVFELHLALPADYEVESLSADGISHWDEATINKQRQLILYFKNRMRGKLKCHAVLVQNAERKAATLVVPKLSFEGEKRHRGELMISAEQGNRLEIKEKNGVGGTVLVNDGAMTMSLLRKDWSLTLTREVLIPRIEVESLESFRFADTRYQVNGRALIKVENAGTKFLTVEAPANIQNLEIRGKDIARTEKLDDRTWKLEFKRKIFGDYRLNFQYQHYYDSTKELELEGINIKGVERQRGYICLDVPSYMSGKPSVKEAELQPFEPRLLPPAISSAEERKSTYCFRVSSSAWQCKLEFVRHEKAEILQADVKSVDIRTMVSLDGRQLHMVDVAIAGGSKNFLKMKLPAKSTLCSVFSNGEPLQISTQSSQLMIPLNQSMPGKSSRQLQIIYIQDVQGFNWTKAKFDGPEFDLPLKNINWYLYVPKENDYEKFAGTLKHSPANLFFSNNKDQYLAKNKQNQQMSRHKANVLLKEAYELSNSGRRDLARKTFESVVNLSESMSDINEDARIQLQATLRQQTLVGLVNRRQNLKASVSGGNYEFDERRYNKGFFSDSFAKAVEKTLEDEESHFLSKVSDKMMAQQAAATQRLIPLRLNLPEEGRQLRFYRQVQIEPMAAMNVSFETEKEIEIVPVDTGKKQRSTVLFALLFMSSFLLMGASFKRKQA